MFTKGFWLLLLTMVATSAQAALKIDGKIDEAEWASAQHITDFKLVQPLSGANSPYPTEAWVLATPEGLAIAFRNTQPANVPRTRQRTQRDEDAQVDRVNLMVDFDGDGGAGYNFTLNLTDGIIDTVITNENNFSKDWDGSWQHAVSESGDTWSAEMLIPWHVAPMKEGVGGQRILGIYLDRVIGSTGERVAWPAASFTRARFLSDFSKVPVTAYSQSLTAITPYVVAVTDRVNGGTHFDTGADIYWKPSGRFQLTATLNPDFGQVESDQLVVNFDAVETFFSDKRPFFTENQGLFDLPFGAGGSNLIYTRRVGGLTDDQAGAGDVTAAVKLNGNVGRTDYGFFAASEADAVGRDFYALRLTHDFGAQDFGMLATRVVHPYLDRTATVIALDHHWKPDQRWNIVSQWVRSDVSQNGSSHSDNGMQIRINNEREHGWRQELYVLHLGDNLQLNDFGYLDRNNFNYVRYELDHRVTDLPDTSFYRSHDWKYIVSTRYDDHGLRIYNAAKLARNSDTASGGNEYFEIVATTSGNNDLITRGHGPVRVPARLFAYYELNRPRRGHWSWYGNARIGQSGLQNIGSSDVELSFQPTFHVNDNLSFYANLDLAYFPDWLLWQHDTTLATFRGKQANFSAGLQWLIGSRQELRVKLETIALDTKLKQVWQTDANGTASPVVDGTVHSFALNNLGFQIRYRYELAPLSDLFVVYSRGGFGFINDDTRTLGGLLGDSFSLRDSEQLLVKLSYRFQL